MTLLRSRRAWIALALAALAAVAFPLLTPPSKAQAHPLGNFTINHYSRIELSPDGIFVHYVLDMAEIPAFQEQREIDADADGTVSAAEGSAYLEQQAERLREGLFFVINERAVELRAVASDLSFPPGQGGLDTLRIEIDFTAPMPEGWEDGAQQAHFRDDNYRDRIGWREILARSGDGVRVFDSTALAEDVSEELRAYPEEGLNNPLRVGSAIFSFEPGVPAATGGEAASTEPAVDPEKEERAVRGNPDSTLARYAELIAEDRLTIGVIVIALLAAVGFGALHALSPGHGKTIVAAYLVGSRGTWRHALVLALTVTATHTSSVYALGFITLYLSEYILPEDLYPWLSVASGALILAMGLALFFGRLWSSRLAGEAFEWLKARLSAAPARQLALAGAAVTPGGEHYDHAGAHDHSHSHEAGRDAHDAPGTPRHGFGPAHSDAVPGQDGQPVRWRGLIGLGIFGGLLPCPSAIVVMLSAIALHRVAFGLLLIVVFSFGLAAVLTAIGFVLVYAGAISRRMPIVGIVTARLSNVGGLSSLAVRAFPVGSAAVVVIAGLVVTLRGLSQQGFL